MSPSKKSPNLIQSIIPLIVLIVFLAGNVIVFGNASLDGANQLALLFSAAVAGLFAAKIGYKWKDIERGMVKSIGSAMPSILILLLIGALAGTWLLSGIVPAMIYYGLKILNPAIFLFAACIICAMVSLATGSSWSTIATVGIALLGIGKALGVSEGLIAGAVISGAYFGDKMSPLSDTTNLAPAVAGTDLFTHIRYMMWTTVPSMAITLIAFLVLGFTVVDGTSGGTDVSAALSAIESQFSVTPVLFLVPIGVIVMIIKKVPALPALLVGVLSGAVFALIFQPDVVMSLSEGAGNSFVLKYSGVLKAMYGEIYFATPLDTADSNLLSSGGMSGMLNTIWLIICAMLFGGVMESCGMLSRITTSVIKRVRSTGSLIGSTAATCLFFNVTASDQYMAIVVPGKMYAKTYRDRGLSPENLSRTLEDSGTVTSVLVPWNTCGATQSSILGVATMAYLPYCFFNLISPVMTILYGFLGIKIKKLTSKQILDNEKES